MSAKAKAFVLTCIDPRFRHATSTFVERKFRLKPTEYDLKTDAGGAREVTQKGHLGKWITDNAGIAYHRHGARTFVLVNHADCAYYGGSVSFASFNEERLTHEVDLKDAAGILKEQFPDVKVYAYLVSKEEKPRERFIFQQVV